MTQPAIAVRAAREAVKVEKAAGSVRASSAMSAACRAKAGTQAALDGLKLAEGPRDVSRIARLAAEIRRQDPRGAQARRPARHRADVSAFNLFNWMLCGDHDLVRLLRVLQARRRTRHRALDPHRRKTRARLRAGRASGPQPL